MSLKAKVEAIIYAAEEPVTLEQISLLLKDVVLAELASTRENLAIEQADAAATSEATVSEMTFEADSLPDSGSGSASESASDLAPESDSESASDLAPESDSESASDLAPESASDLSCEAGELSIELSESPELSPEAGPLMPSETPVADSSEEPASEAPASEEPASSEEPAEPAVAPSSSAALSAPESTSRKRQPKKSEQEIADDKAVRARVREILIELVTDYTSEDRGMEIRQVAGGFRMATKPEHHDVVRAFAKSLKPPIRLSLAALETLAVIAYKQPITGPEIAEIRGVESASVLGTLLDRKLITTAGRKQVIGRPMQYKTSKDFLLRFGLNDVNELPSMEEFSQLASDGTIEIAPADAQQTPSLFEPDASATTSADAANEAPEQPASLPSELPMASTVETQDSQQDSSPAPQQPGTPEAADSQPSHDPEPTETEPADPEPAEPEPSHSEAGHPIGHQ
jgi:segregation and condensation protein B